MGRKAREIVQGDVGELINELNRLYADEWVAIYYYKLAAKIASGRSSPQVASKIEEFAKDEDEHQSELADRIIELGSEPVRDLSAIPKTANCAYVNLPKDASDLEGVVNAIIDAERCAIDGYTKLLRRIMSDYKDPLTFQIVRHILQEEVAHEEAMENLL